MMQRYDFSKISLFLERTLLKHIEWICSLDRKLFFMSIYSIRIRSRKGDIFEKPLHHISEPYVLALKMQFPCS